MDINQLRERLTRIFVHHWDVFAERPDCLERKIESVERFAERLHELFGVEPVVTGPQNTDNYYRIQIALSEGAPSDRFDLDFYDVAEHGPAEYLEVLCSSLAPVAEASWHVFRVEDDQFVHESFDLLDECWLRAHPSLEDAALAVITIGEDTNLTVLGWDITRSPADPEWPPQQFTPENPELRHYLFMGYYD